MKRRAPWWLFVVAASYLAYFFLHTYVVLRGVESAALGPSFRDGGTYVKTVDPGGPAGRAGLQVGDRIVAVNGQNIRNVLDWYAARANFEIGKPSEFAVQRNGQALTVKVTLQRTRLPSGPLEILFLLTGGGMMILALIIGFRRFHDPPALVGAWLLGTMALADVAPLAGSAAGLRQLPLLVQGMLWIAGVGQFVSLGTLFTFCAIFPRPLFRARWVWVAVWAPAAALGLGMLGYGLQIVYWPGQAVWGADGLLLFIAPTIGVYVLASLGALWWNYRRLEDANERRRVRVLVLGMALGWLGALPLFIFVYWQQAAPFARAFLDSPLSSLSVPLFLAFPFSFAYAVLRHRLFDIRVMLRMGLQYALARGVVNLIVPLSVAVIVVDLAVHSAQPLGVIFYERSWIYFSFAAICGSMIGLRGSWMERLDRRFFRERYDAQRLLREVAEEVRLARNLDRAAPRVAAQIEAALHPEFVAVMTRSAGEAQFKAAATAPADAPPPLIPSESKLLGLLRVLGKPLELARSDSSWLQQQLPPEETDFLRRARIDLLIPVAAAPAGGSEALLVLGIKRSEEPYTREDQDLLLAVASSLALVLERPAEPPSTGRTSTTFEECPKCGACYDSGMGRCATEGAPLTPMPVPRLLTGRYRLERRLGRGGMGAVYEATDGSLKRAVAVKLIREDLLGSAEASHRFEMEAQVAASFTHPNVVTVYDYGIAAGSRAFLVMELLRGASLREELRAKSRLPAPQAAGILRGVCAAVEAAHRRQLIHRDLKPENIFLAREEAAEQVKVLDFGLAKFLSLDPQATVDTNPNALLGTFAYMSPEQLSGEPPHVSWDVWALAVIAYEMLAGAKPFTGTTSIQWQNAVISGPRTPITAHLPNASPRLGEFFAAALAPPAGPRPPSAATFFSAFEKAIR